MKQILVVSTLPSTSGVGGVTIHTQRLLESKDLESEKYRLIFFDYKKNSLKDYFRNIGKCDAIHIHVSNPKARIAFVAMAKARGKKVILTIHGNLGRHKPIGNFFDNLAIRWSDIPILINQKSYERAIIINRSSVIMPAFIPPQTSEPLPENVISLLKNIDRTRYRKVYATNAYRQSYDEKGNEIYGISFLLNFFANTKNDSFLILSDPSGEYSKNIGKGEIPDNMAIISYRHSFFELLKECDGMIRATSTDGDALSVKEALSLGKNVIATDCVERPEGVSLFRYNDSKSLLEALDRSNQEKVEYLIDSAIPYLKELYLEI